MDAAFARFDLCGRDGYVNFLKAHAQALPALEAALEAAGAPDLLPDWADRRRTDALHADLHALGASPPPAVEGEAPAFRSAAEALGGLYVLEGSRLGARVLARAAAASPDPQVRAALRYLRHGEDRRFWPDFLKVLEAHPAAADLDALTTGARTAFDGFERAAVP